jgi:hypothetical protein
VSVRVTSSSPADPVSANSGSANSGSAPRADPQTGPAPNAIADSLEHEARRLLAAARAAAVPLRLLGGMGIRVLLGERLDHRFRRAIEDLDFITIRRAGPAVERLLAAHGWAPERRFNAVNGARRLLFEEPAGGHRIDVFVGSFRMCHALPLTERLHVREETLPAAELLLTKLQIVALNAKDRGDLYALLLACEVLDDDETLDEDETLDDDETHSPPPGGEPASAAAPAINAPRIAALAAEDWGLHHTLELNLARLRAGLQETPLQSAERERVAKRIAALGAALQAAPKSRGWRLRARVGERRRWYEDPEEIAR